MPKVTSYTPAWLSKPNPGYDIFAAAPAKATHGNQSLTSSSKKNAKPGPRRTIAHRGTEVFIAVGKEIRWAELVYLKETWEDKQQEQQRGQGKANGKEDLQSKSDDGNAQGYRVRLHPYILN